MSKQHSKARKVLEFLQPVLLAIVLSLVIRTYVAEARVIPSGSMIPTLQIGERLIIDHIYYQVEGLSRGDIVVFGPTERLKNEGYKDDFIKRIVGLPGDTIEIKEGILYVNQEALTEPYINEKPLQDFGPFEIPLGNIFVMGDNRNSSYDSRDWGPLPLDNLKGRAIFRYWPVNRAGLIEKE